MTVQIVRKSVLTNNDRAAESIRSHLRTHGIVAINIMGGAGAGKTTLLEAIIPQLNSQCNVGVLEGDITTTRDADRIAALNVPVTQLLTEGGCHLTATLVEKGLESLPLDAIDILFIENVGNPICPANFDLGEHARLSVLSVTEGHDKPEKYPLLFQVADAVAITKCDLHQLTDFDLKAAHQSISVLNPGVPIFDFSGVTQFGVVDILRWIRRVTESTLECASQ